MKIENTHLIFLWTLIFLGSCQEEIVEIIDPPTEEVLTVNSKVTGLIERAALKDGSFDNIMDRASCTSVLLPVSVFVDGTEIMINSEDDFDLIEAIFDEFTDDEDILTFSFPIGVILADHSKVTINSKGELEEITSGCIEGGADDDIECVDFEYPVSASVFNTNTQIAEIITFASDKEIYRFVSDLGEGDLVGIGFPITMILLDGTTLVANDNNELEIIIGGNEDQCDEDDNRDYDDDDDDDDPDLDDDLVSVLLDGEWSVSSFSNNGANQTGDFTGYVFTFNADKTVLADNGSNQFNGTWSHKQEDNGSQELGLTFGGNAPFVNLDDDWDVELYDSTMIKLMDEDTSEGSKRFLTLEKR